MFTYFEFWPDETQAFVICLYGNWKESLEKDVKV